MRSKKKQCLIRCSRKREMSDNDSSNALDRNSMTFSTTKLFPMIVKDLGKGVQLLGPESAWISLLDAGNSRKN